jgi:hypothetical protein
MANDVLGAAVANSVLTAAHLNGWGNAISYTPALTASTTNPTLGNSTVTGNYVRYDQLYIVHVTLTIGSTFSVGSGTYYLSLPVSLAGSVAGTGSFYDSSTGNIYPIIAVNTTSSSTVALYQTDVVNTVLTHAVPVTPGTGDIYNVMIIGRTP